MKQVDRTSRVYAAGSTTLDFPASALGRFVGVECSVSREGWPDGVDYVLESGQIVPNTAVVVKFERTKDGTAWELIGSQTLPGGVQIHPRTGEVNTSNRLAFWFTDRDNKRMSMLGDVRVTLERLVPLRAALTATLLEEGD